MLKPVWIVGFTGHCPADETPGRSPAELNGTRERVRTALERFHSRAGELNGRIEVFSSVADGADLICAEVAREMQITRHVILPLPEHRFASDFEDSPEAWRRARSLIDSAKSDVYGGTIRVARGSHSRPECYYDAGQQMLEACDALIAIWDGKDSGGVGGTADMVEQARAMGLPIGWIDPRTDGDTITWENMDGVWKQDEVLLELDEVIQKRGGDPICGESVSSACESLDKIATEAGKTFKDWIKYSVVLHFTAALLATINAAYIMPEQDDRAMAIWSKVLTATELLLVSVALWLAIYAFFSRHHEIWRQARFAAEVQRGIIKSRHFIDPLFPLVIRHSPGWRRFALTSGLLAHREPSTEKSDLGALKSDYLKNRIRYQREQYFHRYLAPAVRLASICQWLGTGASILAPFFILWSLIAKIWFQAWADGGLPGTTVTAFLPIFLPLLAGAATSLKVVSDADRRKERYRNMVNRLEAIESWFGTLRTESTVRRTVARTEEILLDELVEWYAASKGQSNH